jgi:oxalate decarboxylase/phosphoglucose isomerase-like protein (cupin superfamily)
MLPPHFHPRGANFVVAISGNTTTYMYEENGAHAITEILTPMKATIFPQGSLHMMVNTGRSRHQSRPSNFTWAPSF